MAGKKLLITQIRSGNRHLQNQKQTLRCLGLGRIGKSIEQNSNPAILGMVRTVSHLVKVKVVE